MSTQELSDNGMIATWAIALGTAVVAIVAATYFNAIQNGNITNLANERTDKEVQQKEANLQAVRLECAHSLRIWIEPLAVCLPKEAKEPK